jgi:protein tyrosine phosphatase (PTP) superfamily phosphohydrolase (DUF442 family)
MRSGVVAALIAAGLCLSAVCGQDLAVPADPPSRPAGPEKISSEHLPNAYRLHERILSGGEPDGGAGFRELRALGVKTIITVDGAKPDVAGARKYGLRYVHLPHGYDGIPSSRAAELAKAVRDLDGPVYVHCHHGKHRSPAAAVTAAVALGLLEPGEASEVLRTCGTSPHYRGLYRSVAEMRPISNQRLDELAVVFVETAAIPPVAEAMVEIEHTFDRLALIQKAGWRSPPEHPDLDPPHEALLLREHFTELLRTEDVRTRPEDFRKLLQDSEHAAEVLEQALRDAEQGSTLPAPQRLNPVMETIAKNCASCHARYRDIPLDEKPAR